MQRTLAVAVIAVGMLVGACSGSSGHKASSTTSTSAQSNAGLTTAQSVCLQLKNTDVARNANPPTMTDDQADAVFQGLAAQLQPAMKVNPERWKSLDTIATKLHDLLVGTGSDDAIENAITAMESACSKVPAIK